MSKATLFLQQMSESHPSVAPQLERLADLHTRKLWHQLTDELEAFLLTASFQGPGALVSFYDNFIKDFALKINKLRLAQIARRVSENYADGEESRVFVEQLIQKEVKGDKQAVLLLESRLASLAMAAENFKEAKTILTDVRTKLDEIPDADPVVHSNLARAAMEFHRSQGTPTEYYKNALLFLSYTPKEKLTEAECQAVAFELGIAACVGEVYNFGELLIHPMIQTLENSPNHWLYGLLVAFNSGSIADYQAITTENAALLEAQPAMVSNKAQLEEKIRLTALLELVFHRPANKRRLSFHEVHQITQQPLEQVEFVLMRAMSLGLIRGVIDEVESVVDISWVQPRVLQDTQLPVLLERLKEWSASVDETVAFMENGTQDIVV